MSANGAPDFGSLRPTLLLLRSKQPTRPQAEIPPPLVAAWVARRLTEIRPVAILRPSARLPVSRLASPHGSPPSPTRASVRWPRSTRKFRRRQVRILPSNLLGQRRVFFCGELGPRAWGRVPPLFGLGRDAPPA